MSALASAKPLPAARDDFGAGVVTVGLEGRLLREARGALGELHPVTAEFPSADDAVEAFRHSLPRPRVLLTAFRSQADERGVRKLNAGLAGWPVVALVDLQAETENLFWANRAGASQLVPLPLDPRDLRAAIDAAGVQFNLCARRAATVVFTPASGGCGASTLALAAAHEIATRHGRKTILIELAPQMGVLATNLNLAPSATLPELIDRADSLDPYLFQNALTPAGENLHVIPGPAGVMPAGWLSRRRMEKVLELARRQADVVVLDVPPTFDAIQLELVNAADHAVLICQQSIAAVRALRLLLDSLGKARAGGTHLVLNLFDPAVRGLSVEDIQRAMGTTGFRPVPRDAAGTLAAVNLGQPLRDAAPSSPVLKPVAALVAQMLGEPPGGRSGGAGVFSRFFHSLRS